MKLLCAVGVIIAFIGFCALLLVVWCAGGRHLQRDLEEANEEGRE